MAKAMREHAALSILPLGLAGSCAGTRDPRAGDASTATDGAAPMLDATPVDSAPVDSAPGDGPGLDSQDAFVLYQDKGWPDITSSVDGSRDAAEKYRLSITLVQFLLFNGKPFRITVAEAGNSMVVAQMEVPVLLASPNLTLSFENAVEVGKST